MTDAKPSLPLDNRVYTFPMSDNATLDVPHASPVNTHRYLSDPQRQAIIVAVSSGRSQTSVAKEFGVHLNTVNRIINTVRNTTKQAGITASGSDWRQSQTQRAVRAVDAGLDATDDPYKRATIGVQALKGLGVYVGDNAGSTTNVFIAQMQNLPADWREKYVRSEDVIDATVVAGMQSASLEGASNRGTAPPYIDVADDATNPSR